MISKTLLNMIVCPNCKGKIELNKSKKYLFCKICSLAYEIKNDIPIMIVEKAKKVL